MNRIALFVATVAFALVMVPAVSNAAPDPLCVGVTQPPSLDFSTGMGAMCFPSFDGDGVALQDTKILTCTVTFSDGSGTQLSVETFTGAPGSLHSYSVPRDGIGSAVAGCTLDELVSAESSVIVTFPVGTAPNPPIILLIP
jgi:hypothetical protein